MQSFHLLFKWTVCSRTISNLRGRSPVLITRTVKSNSSFTYYTFSTLQFLAKQPSYTRRYLFFYTVFFPPDCSLFTGKTGEGQLLAIDVLPLAMLANPHSSKSVQRTDALWFYTYYPHCKSVLQNTVILKDVFPFIATFVIGPWKGDPPCCCCASTLPFYLEYIKYTEILVIQEAHSLGKQM